MHEVKVHFQVHENEHLWKEKVMWERKAGVGEGRAESLRKRNQSLRVVLGTAFIVGERKVSF